MRVFRLGMVVVVLAALYGGVVGIRLMRAPSSPDIRPEAPGADVSTVKSDLCKLAAEERAYFETARGYATESQLRSNGNLLLPPSSRWPYHYMIAVPSPDMFTIVATSYGPLGSRPVAVVADVRGQVCTVTPTRPRFTHQLDDPPQHWGDAAPLYACEACKGR